MAKRKKRRSRKPKRAKKGPQLTTSQYTNLPRFLAMLAVGLVGLVMVFYWAAVQTGAIGGDAAQDAPPAATTAPPPDGDG